MSQAAVTAFRLAFLFSANRKMFIGSLKYSRPADGCQTSTYKTWVNTVLNITWTRSQIRSDLWSRSRGGGCLLQVDWLHAHFYLMLLNSLDLRFIWIYNVRTRTAFLRGTHDRNKSERKIPPRTTKMDIICWKPQVLPSGALLNQDYWRSSLWIMWTFRWNRSKSGVDPVRLFVVCCRYLSIWQPTPSPPPA